MDKPKLTYKPYIPSLPFKQRSSSPVISFFDRIKQADILLHHPYESFEPVLDLLREASKDPQVLAIKQTVYRTGDQSPVMEALIEAAQNGKEVTVVVELKARFDEEANINWAEKLEYIGAQVVYGVVGLKTHAKMLLVSRREGRFIRRYAHLSTGNYNPKTAKLYTDLSHLTSDTKITQDVETVFNLLANQSKIPRLNKLMLAPFHLQKNLIELTKQTAQAAHEGQKCRIILKMNTLTDESLMATLVEAGQAGVQIDLIVRGACMLPAQRAGFTDNIRVRSIIGRFLEHSRVFYFASGKQESLYLSSADWMNRNMLRRVELAWPVEDPKLRQRIFHECLQTYLQDHVDAWVMHANGQYVRAAPPKSRSATVKVYTSAQQQLMTLYANSKN